MSYLVSQYRIVPFTGGVPRTHVLLEDEAQLAETIVALVGAKPGRTIGEHDYVLVYQDSHRVGRYDAAAVARTDFLAQLRADLQRAPLNPETHFGRAASSQRKRILRETIELRLAGFEYDQVRAALIDDLREEGLL